MLHTAKVPLQYWPYAFDCANYIINKLPTPLLDYSTPYEQLLGKPPDYSSLEVFGCLCYPWLRPNAKNKLEPRSLPCVFLGYSKQHKGYRCLELSSSKFYISRHVQFDEMLFPFAGSMSSPIGSKAPESTPVSLLPGLP